jgi:hypothetical protein
VGREAFAVATIVAAVFLSFEAVQTGTSIPTLPKKLLPSTVTIYIPYSSTDPFWGTLRISGVLSRGAKQPKRGAGHFRSSFQFKNKYSFTSTLSIRFRGAVLWPRYRCTLLVASNLVVGFLRTCL